MAVEEFDMGLACLEEADVAAFHSLSWEEALLRVATPDRTNLTAAIKTAAHNTLVHIHIGVIHIAVDDIAAAKDVACTFDVVGGLVVQLLYIFIHRCIFCPRVLVAVADVAVVEGNV